MKIKYVIAAAAIAMLAVPGTAAQLAARSAMSQPLIAPPAAVSTAGLFHDPNSAPQLTIQLPTTFQALDVGNHPLQSFNG